MSGASPKWYALRYTLVKAISSFVTHRGETIEDVAKRDGRREKLDLPPWFIQAVDAARTDAGLSIRMLAKKAGVMAPSVIRLRRGEASWDTVVRVAAALGLAPPILIDPSSPAGRLERLRLTNPEEYRVICRLLGNTDGDFALATAGVGVR